MKKLCMHPLSWMMIFISFIAFKTNAQQSSPPQNAKPVIEKRKYPATKISKSPKIDGQPTDDIWQTVPKTGEFTQFDPKPFDKPTLNTEVKLAYDDEAIYVLAYLYDNPADIRKDMTQRDQLGGNTDFFTMSFDPFDDDQNGVRFAVTAGGVQADCKVGKFELNDGNGWTNTDFSWDAVWENAVTIQNDGWVVEMKIPYMALRFPKKPVQSWGLQFARQVKRLGETDTWQPLDPNVDGQVIQWGFLTDLKDIKPPLRLSLSPYLATTYERSPITDNNGKETYGDSRSISGGLDLKYGINESFTLDATLIPNFGQVQSDNQVLNLSPFEVQFNEYRPFFTEGSEIFNKGNIFYSRRIGGTPLNFWNVQSQLHANEVVKKNPSETQLYNATKISGRTGKKLGIGFLNAVAAPMYATVENTETGVQRKIQTAELTNYNITVLSQALKNNSEISFTNANTLRNGTAADANVSAGKIRLRDKNNTYEYAIGGKMSHIFDPSVEKTSSGYAADWSVQRVSGKWTWSVDQTMQTDKWNPNDLGIFTGNNFLNSHVGVFMFDSKPNKYFLQSNIWFNLNHNMRYKPFVFQDYGINGGFWVKFKNQSWANHWFYTQPSWTYDYFEPRYEGKKYKLPPVYNAGINIGTDERKPSFWYFYLGTNRQFGGRKQARYTFIVNPRFRVSQKLSIQPQVLYALARNEHGYSTSENEDNIIFGSRNRNTVENSLRVNYNFTPKMNISFRARHYWSEVKYKRFFKLLDNGDLQPNDWKGNQNVNINFFNIDLIYTWQFAPGSFINAIWKNSVNAIERGDDVLQNSNYFGNVNHTFNSPQTNNLTLKVIYFLDYQVVKRLSRGNR